jgi:AraC-like DNA-binding protein
MERYSPIGNSKNKNKNKNNVFFCEARPPEHLASVVHRYIKIWTDKPLKCDYRFHALPDACTYLIFDQLKPDVVGPATLGGKSMEFNLGRIFHYVNIRFFPGVWQSDRVRSFVGQINQSYDGNLPLLAINQELLGQPFDQQLKVLNKYVEDLVDHKFLVTSVIITRILKKINSINSVADMAKATRVSSRHLQRCLKQETGFTPHNFLKVIRLQRTLSGSDLDQYSDQAHFIRSFRHATGRTPSKFYEEFDV